MKQEIIDLPRFSSLARCLLVDSSHKSRNDIVKDIKSSSLFEEIVEAKSIHDGAQKIEMRSFDACLLGPSLSLDFVTSFFKQVKTKTMSQDCAFIAVIKGSLELAFVPEAHSFVGVPCTKQTFFEAVVRGVLIANKGSAWPGVKLCDDGTVMFLEGSEWKVLRSDYCDSPISNSAIPESFLLTGDQVSIQRFCDGLSSSPPSRIDKIIKTLLASNGPADDPFVTYFLSAIKEWKDDQSFLSLKEASHNLRAKLLAFKG